MVNEWIVLMAVLGGSLTANAVAVFWMWRLRKHLHYETARRRELDQMLAQHQEERAEETASHESQQQSEWQQRCLALQSRYDLVMGKLAEAGIERHFRQPVLLVGPRGVGKTSLLVQWHAPWEEQDPGAPTVFRRRADVPVLLIEHADMVEHWADPSVKTPLHAVISLRVFDFPGEPNAQREVLDVVREETARAREESRRDLGIVVVCMFDAGEVASGVLEAKTGSYYNGELFSGLRTLLFEGKVRLERLVLVFNKTDRLRASVSPGTTDEEIHDRCLQFYLNSLPLVTQLCNRERMSTVLTMLNHSTSLESVQGAPAVMREASKSLMDSFHRPGVVQPVAPNSARKTTGYHKRAMGGETVS
jgi:GTPase SAR1 family protein